jgi:hypothetical protein
MIAPTKVQARSESDANEGLDDMTDYIELKRES